MEIFRSQKDLLQDTTKDSSLYFDPSNGDYGSTSGCELEARRPYICHCGPGLAQKRQ